MLIVPDGKKEVKKNELDERLLVTPALALSQSREVAVKMAECAKEALTKSLHSFYRYSQKEANDIREAEALCDHYEDILGTYLIKVSSAKLGQEESEEVTMLLKAIGDFERISDHAVNILESAEELREKKLTLSEEAMMEYDVIAKAVSEVLALSKKAFATSDISTAMKVEPLEQVVDGLKEKMRTRHILRMQEGKCSVEVGFIWSDLLTNLERVSDHCSNIAGCVIDSSEHNLNVHKTLKKTKAGSKQYDEDFLMYSKTYSI